jgi:hypothetical protein
VERDDVTLPRRRQILRSSRSFPVQEVLSGAQSSIYLLVAILLVVAAPSRSWEPWWT